MQSSDKSQPKLQKAESKMGKHDSKNEHDDIVTSQRRSRKDVDGRDHICGCGKRYLSYPALYTHIKTKHEGREPQGTQKNTGAPSRKSKAKVQQERLAEMTSFISQQDFQLLEVIDKKLHGVTPLSSRFSKEFLSKDIIQVYSKMIKQPNPLKLNKDSSLEQYLVAYLVGAGQQVVQKLHHQYQQFARSLKECYYELGQIVYQKCFSKKDSALGYLPEFNVQKVKYLPIICDFYITEYVTHAYSHLNVSLMELILCDFCKWLTKRRSTYVEAILRRQYSLPKPLEFQQQSAKIELQPRQENINGINEQKINGQPQNEDAEAEAGIVQEPISEIPVKKEDADAENNQQSQIKNKFNEQIQSAAPAMAIVQQNKQNLSKQKQDKQENIIAQMEQIDRVSITANVGDLDYQRKLDMSIAKPIRKEQHQAAGEVNVIRNAQPKQVQSSGNASAADVKETKQKNSLHGSIQGKQWSICPEAQAELSQDIPIPENTGQAADDRNQDNRSENAENAVEQNSEIDDVKDNISEKL